MIASPPIDLNAALVEGAAESEVKRLILHVGGDDANPDHAKEPQHHDAVTGIRLQCFKHHCLLSSCESPTGPVRQRQPGRLLVILGPVIGAKANADIRIEAHNKTNAKNRND